MIWDDLLKHYSEAHRHYHNLEHIDCLLTRLEGMPGENDGLELAVWYHDCIYDPASPDNEAQSAWHFSRILGPFLETSRRDEVCRLILATDHSRPRSGRGDENLLIDLDLSILGAPEIEYDQYRDSIRKEFSFVPDADYCKGRCAVLKKFLSDKIFSTLHFAHLEEMARSNLLREIAHLSESHRRTRDSKD